jgi:hypothetical protein
MAEYYCLFSVDVKLRKGKQPAARELMDEGMRVRREMDAAGEDTWDHGFDFDYTWDDAGHLTIYSEEHGCADHAVSFIETLVRNKIAIAPVAFYWANTCSKPRWGEFDGGGALITREKTYWYIPRVLIDNKWAQIKKEQAMPKKRKR